MKVLKWLQSPRLEDNQAFLVLLRVYLLPPQSLTYLLNLSQELIELADLEVLVPDQVSVDLKFTLPFLPVRLPYDGQPTLIHQIGDSARDSHRFVLETVRLDALLN